MKIEEGKFYKDREGEVQGPAVRREGKVLYTFKVGDTSYSDKGEFITGATSDQDLIEEVPDPSLPKPVPVEIHPSRLSDSMEAYRASENHVFRVKYREMTDFEKRTMEELKSRAYWLLCHIEAHIPDGRYKSLAKTALEESVMWAVKEITK